MDKNIAQILARKLIYEYNLKDWKIEFNRRKKGMGRCDTDTKTIFLSKYYVDLNNEDIIKDTILHEIAHALVGIRHNHDNIWKEKCIEIGALPYRVADVSKNNIKVPDYNHIYSCPICKKEYKFHRLLTKIYACSACCKTYDNKYKLVKTK